VVYESTVYPGATEEKCIPLLERVSHLQCGKDFGVGYSPDRINPGDKTHTFATIPKIVSAINSKTLDIIENTYSPVVPAGTHRVSSIRIAEAAKIIENTQRDINISLMNEIALILHCLGMDSAEVLAAARTKWNFLPFQPGLVGGKCIGVNSFYLTYKAEEAGYHPNVILAGRKINDDMPQYIATITIQNLRQLGKKIKGAKIAVFGLTYKENCAAMSGSKVLDLIKELKKHDIEIMALDPHANPAIVKNKYGIHMLNLKDIKKVDAIIFALAHKEFYELSITQIKKIIKPKSLIVDIKGIFNPELFKNSDIMLWRL
jgi:UDP-N-acetyl-D-galactosamine dehydrogenase